MKRTQLLLWAIIIIVAVMTVVVYAENRRIPLSGGGGLFGGDNPIINMNIAITAADTAALRAYMGSNYARYSTDYGYIWDTLASVKTPIWKYNKVKCVLTFKDLGNLKSKDSLIYQLFIGNNSNYRLTASDTLLTYAADTTLVHWMQIDTLMNTDWLWFRAIEHDTCQDSTKAFIRKCAVNAELIIVE